jgi:hypothetical protein
MVAGGCNLEKRVSGHLAAARGNSGGGVHFVTGLKLPFDVLVKECLEKLAYFFTHVYWACGISVVSRPLSYKWACSYRAAIPDKTEKSQAVSRGQNKRLFVVIAD